MIAPWHNFAWWESRFRLRVCVWFELKKNTTETNINLTKNEAIAGKTEYENYTNDTYKR